MPHSPSYEGTAYTKVYKRRPVRGSSSKRRIDCIKQSNIAEGLEQALHGTLFENSGADGLICLSRYENEWDLLPAELKFPLQIGSAHAWHRDIQE